MGVVDRVVVPILPLLAGEGDILNLVQDDGAAGSIHDVVEPCMVFRSLGKRAVGSLEEVVGLSAVYV